MSSGERKVQRLKIADFADCGLASCCRPDARRNVQKLKIQTSPITDLERRRVWRGYAGRCAKPTGRALHKNTETSTQWTMTPSTNDTAPRTATTSPCCSASSGATATRTSTLKGRRPFSRSSRTPARSLKWTRLGREHPPRHRLGEAPRLRRFAHDTSGGNRDRRTGGGAHASGTRGAGTPRRPSTARSGGSFARRAAARFAKANCSRGARCRDKRYWFRRVAGNVPLSISEPPLPTGSTGLRYSNHYSPCHRNIKRVKIKSGPRLLSDHGRGSPARAYRVTPEGSGVSCCVVIRAEPSIDWRQFSSTLSPPPRPPARTTRAGPRCSRRGNWR